MKLISITSPAIVMDELSLVSLPEDSILLRQDAVYLCARIDIVWPTIQLYALDIDVNVRQVQVANNISVISAERWVELCIEAQVNILWHI
ncbi:DsrH/TusB family sulfur metabolism protein [Rheinheimera maricola]|uniref:DsrH/TusB family sulfur relay protein n=1 Tax=Rheinheimera maricola TaxID=2793282 RepID=A0ABS7X581_9GAMM|nr:DsrH/TusB family sulfur metabolism protein [Rheinheimera maricola]MBZ9610704.1 DsrH/TusB family sulfur relay protein [Rheinheimera maricola]